MWGIEDWNPKERKDEVGPRIKWQRSVLAEVERTGITWSVVKALAGDGWLDSLVRPFAPTGVLEIK